MIIKRLLRSSRLGKKYGGNGIKYFVDCTDTKNTPICDKIINSVINQDVLYSKSDREPVIIKSILEMYKIQTHNKTKKRYKTSNYKTKTARKLNKFLNKPIVIKTWYYGIRYESVYKEFNIGKQLEDIPGFIKYIAYIRCTDGSFTKKTKDEMNEEIRTLQKSKRDIISIKIKDKQICQGNDDIKQLLIMPYYPLSSIGTYKWDESKSNQLLSLFKQIIWSSYAAFVKYGFIHNDMHLQNFMIESNTAPYIIYKINVNSETKTIQVEIYGYQVVIMDFERSITNTYSSDHTMDISIMLSQLVGTKYQQIFIIINKQKLLWQDFRRLFGEIDDIHGVKIKKISEARNNRIENIILSFIKDRIDLFSNSVINEQFSEDESQYKILIQKLYIIKSRNIDDIEEELLDDLYNNIQNALYEEITKLYNLVSTIVFVDK